MEGGRRVGWLGWLLWALKLRPRYGLSIQYRRHPGSSGLAWCVLSRRPAVVVRGQSLTLAARPRIQAPVTDRIQSKHPAPLLTDDEPRQA